MRTLMLVTVLSATFGAFASGQIFVWKGPAWGAFDDPANWDVGEAGAGNAGNLIPGAEDAFYHESAAKIDLNGGSFTVKNRAKTLNADWNGDGVGSRLELTNGTLTVTSSHSAKLEITVWNGAEYKYTGSRYADAHNIYAEANQIVKAGGVLSSEGSSLQVFGIKLVVEEGGTFNFKQTNFYCWPTTAKVLSFTNNGEFNAPNGIYLKNLGWGGGADVRTYFPKFYQKGGTMTIGDKIGRKNSTEANQVGFYVEGGTVRISDGANVFFENMSAEPPKVVADADVTFDVGTGATFNLDGMVIENGARITKTGAGKLVFTAALPSELAVDAGAVRFASTVEIAEGVVFGTGSTLELAASDIVVDSYDSVKDLAAVVIDPSLQVAGTVLVESEDAEALAFLQTKINAAFAGGQFEADLVGSQIKVATSYDYTFDSTKANDLADGAGWKLGTVPAAGTAVMVKGGRRVRLGTDAPAFSAITVYGGSSVSVEAGTVETPFDLPDVTLNYEAALVIASDSYVRMTNTFTCITDANCLADPALLPVLEIATNATLVVQSPEKPVTTAPSYTYGPKADQGWRIKNVNLKWYGTIRHFHERSGTGDYCMTHIGYADADETTYIGLDCQGGTLLATGEDNASLHSRTPLEIARAIGTGGRVRAVGTLRLRDYHRTMLPNDYETSSYALTGNDFGFNNPVDEMIDLLVEGTTDLQTKGMNSVGGGVHLVLRGEVKWWYNRTAYNDHSQARGFNVMGQATVTLEDGALLDLQPTNYGERYGFYGSGYSDQRKVGGASLTVRNAGVRNFIWRGKGVDTAVMDDATLTIGRLTMQEQASPMSVESSSLSLRTPAFAGFAAVQLDAGGLTVTAGDVWGHSSGYSTWMNTIANWNREVSMGPAMTGVGGLTVSNSLTGAHNVYSMTVVVSNGANTATGVAKALASAETAGGAPCGLVFADGANWAGTVVANGCVSLTNLVDGAAAATVDFGTIRFEDAFPVRVWKNGDAIATNDVVNLSSAAVGTDGGFAPVAVNGEFKLGDSFVLGRYPADAVFPRAAKNWIFKTLPTEDDAVVLLKAAYFQQGTLLIFK